MSGDWGLTERGFRRPTYAELLDALEFKSRELFGSNANLTVRSPLGIFLRLYAWVLGLLFATLEDVYNSRFIDTAVGTSLFNLGRAIGLRLLAAQRAVGYLLIKGNDGELVPEGWLAATMAGTQYVIIRRGIISDGNVLLPAQAVLAGPGGNTPEDTIRHIVNPMEGITAVINPQSFRGGRNTETDAEFRARYYVSVDFAGGVNIDAIRAEILQNVEGVKSVIGFENYTDYWDYEQNLPPHSFEMVVYGGLDEDVATAIFRRKAAGIQTWGDTTIPVFSESGQLYDIKFGRPEPVNIWVNITNLITDPNTFPLDGREQITQGLINSIGGSVTGGLPIGSAVVYKRLPGIIFNSTSGVLDFDLQISGDGVVFGFDNIPIDKRQKAVTDEGSVNIS